MIGPVRIPALGVDAMPNRPVVDKVTSWSWTHPTNGIRINVYCIDMDRDWWSCEFIWRGITCRELDGTMSDLSDAYDVVMSHAQSYVPRLWAELRALESAEEIRVKCLRSQLEDERTEADDELANG